MVWLLKVEKENRGGRYVKVAWTDYTNDTCLLPSEARRLAASLIAEANEADVRNRPGVRKIGSY